ncbi:hypothetical protein IGI04_042769, partial [Brassica rapa subsp. trilocularis]
MISMSQIFGFIYSEENGDIGTSTTHVKQPDNQVHHADESKQKDELNREKLVNHDTVEDDEYHVSGEHRKVEEADTKDPTSASIDSSNSESIDIRTSETIDTNICHRSIPSTIPDATTVKLIIDRHAYHNIDRHPHLIVDRPQYLRNDRHKLLSSCPQDIANLTQESIDESSCDLTSDVDKVTLKDFLELEEWLRQKLDDQPASGKGLENSLKADDIDRHKPDEIDRHPPYDIDLQSPSNIDQHTPDCIARYPPDCIDQYSCLDELSGYPIEPELVGRKEHTSGASHLAVPENLRPLLCEEEAVGICKRVKRIHDPVKFVVPYEVFEAESPIPPDKSMELSYYGGVFDDNKYVEASQRGLRFRDEVDEGPAGAPSSDISKSELIDTNTSSSIDTNQIPSIDTRRESEQNDYELGGNIFYEDTTTHSDKSRGKKWRNWKKKKRINEGSQISLIPHFSDDARKSRVRLHKSVGKKGRNWKKRKRTKGGSQLPLTPYFSDSVRKPRVQGKDPRKTSFHRNRRWLASIDRQSIKGIDRHLTVLVNIHIKDSASYPTIDCLFIVSNDCSSYRPMRPCHYQSTALHQHRSIVYPLCRSTLMSS